MFGSGKDGHVVFDGRATYPFATQPFDQARLGLPGGPVWRSKRQRKYRAGARYSKRRIYLVTRDIQASKIILHRGVIVILQGFRVQSTGIMRLRGNASIYHDTRAYDDPAAPWHRA